ncbi:MAG: PorV/PorQ family protein [Candidatus Kapaibacteriota bacterium]|jgi:hypothetical protein
MLLKNRLFLMIMTTLAFLPITSYSQAGGAAVPFLLISPDARASGMGEVGTAMADDINAVYWNPAGLGFLDYFASGNKYKDDADVPFRQVAIAFSPWLPQFNADLYYSYGTIGQHFDELDGTVAFNFVFMNLGEFTRTDVTGQVLGKFISSEFALGLSYGTIVAPDLSVGFGLRYIQSNLTPTTALDGSAGTGVSGAFDLGVLWKPVELDLGFVNMDDNLSLGLNIQNIGPKITYVRESDPLPTKLRFGWAYEVYADEFNQLTISNDISKLMVKRDRTGSDPLPKSFVTAWDNPGAEFAIGAEYWYEKAIALRMGYFTEPAVLGNREYYNFGLGIKYDIFKADFSFINTVEANHPLANTMRFSLLVDWQ